ncbi:hypothetical protein JCM10207_004962 [Rhodosporidiobolus poonsookiae]
MLRLRSSPLAHFALAFLALLLLAFLVLRNSFDSAAVHNAAWAPGSVRQGGAAGAREMLLRTEDDAPREALADSLVHGGVVMPKLGNATAKAELGRASWKLLHTMAARFPENPTDDERETFKSFLFLFSRLYPCGECAAEFQSLLRKFPPQTSSRTAAGMYLCHLHNQVNARLGKPEFDCATDLEGQYDCGCGPDEDVGEKGKIGTAKGAKAPLQVEREERRAEEGVKRDPETGLELIGG